ncbi:hypothetical protein OROGR_026430 [Orobanche gracilis]
MRILFQLKKFLAGRSSFCPTKNRHTFKTGSPSVENNHKILLRRFRWTALDEDRIFFDILRKTRPLSSTDISSVITKDFPPPGSKSYFCNTSNVFFSLLSPDNKPSNVFPRFKNDWALNFHDYSVTGSAGGVVCFDNDYQQAVFWNPTTKELKFLPKSDLDRPDPDEVYPLTVSTHTFHSGFGFDKESKDHKLIRWVTVWFEDEDSHRLVDSYTKIELYSLRTDSWKSISSPRGGDGFGERLKSATVNDSNFYSTITNHHWSVVPAEIRRFDFSTEEFSYIPFPCTRKRLGITHRHCLFDAGGRLGVVIFDTWGSDKSFELWTWGGDAKVWCRQFDDRIACADFPLGFSSDGQFLFLSGEQDHQLRAYNIWTKEVKEIGIYCYTDHGCKLDVVPYVETTVPLNVHNNESEFKV